MPDTVMGRDPIPKKKVNLCILYAETPSNLPVLVSQNPGSLALTPDSELRN